uniref:ATP binding cassette subfamily A member 12 n=1 Tax=Propithecus coquereli TaxID=379532 RepID=A0A2K6G3B9_PROCO
MVSQCHQLRILVWKNWLGVKRQPLWTLVLILWPVIIFIILAITRTKFPPTAKPTCYLAPRNLPSTGFFPFLQTLLCDTDSKCKDTPYGPQDLLRRKGIDDALFNNSEILRKSPNLEDSNLSLQSTQVPERRHASLATVFPSPNSDLESNERDAFNGSQVLARILGLEKLLEKNSTSEDIRRELCASYPGYIEDYAFSWTTLGKNVFNKFCLSNMTLLESSLQELKKQFSQVTNLKMYIKKNYYINNCQLLIACYIALMVVQKVYPRVTTNEGFRTLQKSVKHLLYTLDSPAQGDSDNITHVWSEDDGQILSPSSLAAQLLILENFEDALLNISANSPYVPYLACVRNVTDNLARGSPENIRLLQSTIRFRKSFLRNGSYEDYFPPVPEVLKSKCPAIQKRAEDNVSNSADTSENPDLIEMFKNVEELKEELRRMTGMSNRSIDKLLAVPIPDNRAEIISRVFWLHSCDANVTNPKLEDAMKEFCSLPLPERSHQSYLIGLTFLHYLDIYNFTYKVFFPRKDQKPVEKMIELFMRLKEILNQMASGTHPLLDKMRSLKQMHLPRNVPLTQAMYRSNRMNTPQGSFRTISQALCSQGITTEYLIAMLPSSQKPKGNHTKDFLTYNLSKKQIASKYGIPLQTSEYTLMMIVLNNKNIVYSSNVTLRQLAELRERSQEWMDKSPLFMNSFHLLNQAIPMLQNTLRNPFVQVFIKFSVGLDAVELLKQIDELDILRMKLENNIDIIDQLNTLSSLTVNISSCVLYDRIQASKTIDEMEREAKRLYKRNELFGSVIFKLPSNRSRHGGYDSENIFLPPVVKYTIRMSLKTAQTTRSIRSKIWAPGPHNSPSNNQIYGRAFIYLQDSIERAIIELQTGRNSQEIAVQVQAIPYPCFMKDKPMGSIKLKCSLIYLFKYFKIPLGEVYEIYKNYHCCSFSSQSLLSPTAFSYASQYIAQYEEQGIGLQWDNMYSSPVEDDTTSFGWLCCLILADSFIYFLIAWYVRNVFPGTYGMAAPWYFPVLPSYWKERFGCAEEKPEKSNGLMFTNIMMQNTNPSASPEYMFPSNIEPEPKDLTVGVALHGVTKIYGSKVAVDNLNLNFYEGHITSLLGPNGAGKTTTISMLTGLFGASAGTIFVYGKDIKTDLNTVRKNMGVCMQHDVLFSYLTTKEHLLLYGSIKVPHWTKKQLHEEVKRTLKDTGLYSHRHKRVGTLSGGMKRKLSISIALIGGSRVVILDEPSTGVDPCSRRSIWDVICKNKTARTMILSTHHLDEAEVLSDRIAFLEHGGLRCCGSPFYLKETFGDGYHLTLTKKKSPNLNANIVCDTMAVTAMIRSHLPEAYLKEDIGGELVYVLPPFSTKVSGAYLSLLRALDNGMGDLNIGCYGISDTTVEEVFLNLTKEPHKNSNMSLEYLTQKKIGSSSTNGISTPDDLSVSSSNFTDRDDKILTRGERLDGLGLLLKKIMAILIKRFHHTRRNWKGLIAQVILPIVFVTTAMGLGTLRNSSNIYPEIQISPSLYGTSKQTAFYANSHPSTKELVSAMWNFPGIDNLCLNTSDPRCLKKDSLEKWNTSGEPIMNFGVCSCSENIQECPKFNYSPPHRRTYSSQIIYNLTGHRVENYLISTANEFVQKRKRAPKTYVCFPLPIAHYRISSLIDILVALSILMGYSVTTASFVTYIVREHQTKAKQLQHISGIGVTCYWVTNFIYDMVSNLHHCKKNRINLDRSHQFYIQELFILVCSNYYHKDRKRYNSNTSLVWTKVYIFFPPSNQCFGLLGVNGAGKTTIFKMLTGDIIPSSGNILIRNKTGSLGHVDSHNSLIGYCPQEDALDDLVTVEEHLYFYARVHGIPEKDIKEVSTHWLSAISKVTTALLLILYIYYSGMDPKSKRHLWKIISEEVQNKCSVILTSHSMEECEALCTRLAIMVNGRFQCIGSLQHIKSRMQFLKKIHLYKKYLCLSLPKLSMLEYHVPVTAGGVANIFDLLETNKIALNITNFLVSQTTLEEVFINFAKDQKSYETVDTSSQGSTISVDSQDDQMES